MTAPKRRKPDPQTTMFDDNEQKPSSYQYAIFKAIATSRRNLYVRARAGTGKTWTIVKSLEYVSPKARVAFFAFNKAIVEALRERAPKGVRVCTLHSFGRSVIETEVVYNKGSHFDVDKRKTRRIVDDLYGGGEDAALGAVEGHPILDQADVMGDLLSRAKDTLTEATVEALDELADRFGFELPPESPRVPWLCLACGTMTTNAIERCWSTPTGKHDLPSPDSCVRLTGAADDDPEAFDQRPQRAIFLEAAARVLKRSEEVVGLIDYGDMCWLPIRLSMPIRQYDLVFVDETQDLSPAQIELLLRTVKPGGRVVVVGDPAQCVYEFRGANLDTLEMLKSKLNAEEMILPISYRCSQAVVRLAQEEVPDIEARPDAPEGRVAHCKLEHLVKHALPGDFVISRANAPLVGVCWELTRAGKRALVKGTDIQGALVSFIEDLADGKDDKKEVLEALEKWREAELQRLLKKKRSTTYTEDKYGCAKELLTRAPTVQDAMRSVRKLFASDQKLEEDEDLRGEAIILGTTHKLKGLEAERVWMLVDTYHREDGGEEANCWYVAVTRAKHSLYLTHLPKKSDS